MSAALDAASRQWASRPDDQRFLTPDDLAVSVGARHELSRVSDVRLDSLTSTTSQMAPLCPVVLGTT
jgi:hypothetical protein